MAQTAKDFFLRTPGTPWMSVPEEESLIIIPPKKPEFLTQASPILEPITDTMVVPPSPLANVGTAPTTGPVVSASEAPIVAPQPIAMQEEPKITTGVVQMPTVQVRHVSPLTAGQVMDAAMDTAGFVHAFGEPDMPGDTFLTRIRGYHKEKAEQANKDMIARAQLLNALKSSRSLSEVEKLQQKAEFLRSMGASDDEIRQSFLKGSGVTVNMGANKMTEVSAKRFADHLGGIDTTVSTLGSIMPSVNKILPKLRSGEFTTGGGTIGDVLTRFGANIGIAEPDTKRNIADFDVVLATHLQTIIDRLNTGPMSDSDRKYYEARTVNLGNSTEDNIRRLEILQEIFDDNARLQRYANQLLLNPSTLDNPALANKYLLEERDQILKERQERSSVSLEGLEFENKRGQRFRVVRE